MKKKLSNAKNSHISREREREKNTFFWQCDALHILEIEESGEQERRKKIESGHV
jgi:hypothetical protein